MDSITILAQSIHIPLLSQINLLLENDFIFAGIILALLLIGENRNDKRVKIVLCLILATLVGLMIKNMLMIPRPCFGKPLCPDDYSFPSLHATIVFALMTGFLNKRRYILYLLFALFVCFSRLNFGVHTFIDIAGALPVALLSYYIVDIGWKNYMEGRKNGKRN